MSKADASVSVDDDIQASWDGAVQDSKLALAQEAVLKLQDIYLSRLSKARDGFTDFQDELLSEFNVRSRADLRDSGVSARYDDERMKYFSKVKRSLQDGFGKTFKTAGFQKYLDALDAGSMGQAFESLEGSGQVFAGALFKKMAFYSAASRFGADKGFTDDYKLPSFNDQHVKSHILKAGLGYFMGYETEQDLYAKLDAQMDMKAAESDVGRGVKGVSYSRNDIMRAFVLDLRNRFYRRVAKGQQQLLELDQDMLNEAGVDRLDDLPADQRADHKDKALRIMLDTKKAIDAKVKQQFSDKVTGFFGKTISVDNFTKVLNDLDIGAKGNNYFATELLLHVDHLAKDVPRFLDRKSSVKFKIHGDGRDILYEAGIDYFADGVDLQPFLEMDMPVNSPVHKMIKSARRDTKAGFDPYFVSSAAVKHGRVGKSSYTM